MVNSVKVLTLWPDFMIKPKSFKRFSCILGLSGFYAYKEKYRLAMYNPCNQWKSRNFQGAVEVLDVANVLQTAYFPLIFGRIGSIVIQVPWEAQKIANTC